MDLPLVHWGDKKIDVLCTQGINILKISGITAHGIGGHPIFLAFYYSRRAKKKQNKASM